MELERREVQGKFGGSATPAIMKKIEEELAAGAAPTGSKAKIEEVDLKKEYVAAVCSFADMDLDCEDEVQVCRRCDVWLRAGRSDRNISPSAECSSWRFARN